MAEYYSAELSVKVKRGLKENALKAKVNGGQIPFGYYIDENQKLAVDQTLAPIVLETFTMYADGYRDKLFAIEVKRWKGRLTETDNSFIQEKTDRWTGEIHSKYQKSPFKQLNRAIYLLRKEITGNVWINSVIYFEDNEFEGISTAIENIWFNNINDLVRYSYMKAFFS